MTVDRVAEVRERVDASTFHRAFGMRLQHVAEGEVDVALEAGPQHLNLMGTVHGGVLATLADTATGLAYRTVLEPGTTFTTIQLQITYLAPGRAGPVAARGRVVKRGRRTGYAEADVVDGEDRLLARATALLAVMPEDQ
ncbi:MAG TPA: PaaI family thioesterase [Actinomycetota bacterium]|nr:PaaI family thioesterase [Actinomycetota bacterium]